MVIDRPADDVQEVQKMVPNYAEYNYQKTYKIKSHKILKSNDNSWEILDKFELKMAKIAYNLDGDKVYLIGGAIDPKSKQTINAVVMYQINPDGTYTKR